MEVQKIFKINGIVVFPDEINNPLQIDSLLFVTLLIQLEDHFQITIPDHYLSNSELVSLSDYCELIQLLIGSK